MFEIFYHNQFKKDVKRIKKRNLDISKIKVLIEKLVNQKQIDAKYKLHKLVGNYQGRLECHLEPDWLLIFKIEKKQIIFERTGSHSDLFK